jgi:hypothetical protein
MVAIKDMEMPSDCMECAFCNHRKNNDYGSYGDCAILGDNERMNLLLHQKHPDCPLVEIITCKDCNNHGISKEYRDIDGARYCSTLRIYTGYDFHCADAERREE